MNHITMNKWLPNTTLYNQLKDIKFVEYISGNATMNLMTWRYNELFYFV